MDHFSSAVSESERQKIQSKIFLDINQNAKPIAADLLLEIQKILDPLASVSIANDVLLYMNEHGVFRNRFRKSLLATSGLKTASIIKFALHSLVSIEKQDDESTFFHYWPGDAHKLTSGGMSERNEYIKFCAENLNLFFADVKEAWNDQWKWDDKESLLPSVVTINGCLIAYKDILRLNGIQKKGYFVAKFKKWEPNFSREVFGYHSSGYGRFGKELFYKIFGEE